MGLPCLNKNDLTWPVTEKQNNSHNLILHVVLTKLQMILTNFSVNFPRDAVESLLTFIFVETWINVSHSKNFSLHVHVAYM